MVAQGVVCAGLPLRGRTRPILPGIRLPIRDLEGAVE